MIIDRLSAPHVTLLWSHLRSRHVTKTETAEAFVAELENRNPTEVIMACLDRRGGDWDAILSALMNRPVYKCAQGETAFPLTDAKGHPITGPRGHRYGHNISEAPPPVPVAPRPRTVSKRLDPRVVLSVKPNPKTPGSKSHARYAMYVLGMTVDQFLEAGGRRADIVHDISKGFITVGYP